MTRRRTSKRRTSRKPTRRRTSRGVARNASCPSCGSPHYYVGTYGPDCAAKGCVNYHGGSTPEPPGRSGMRQILVTFDETTPESSEEGDFSDSGIYNVVKITVDDLDDDSDDAHTGSFARYAAEWVRDNLGHVEGDDWYTQTDGDTDYRTGTNTRLSAHFNESDGWTAEEKSEIHRLLKEKRLLSNRGRVRANVIPPPPTDVNNYKQWAERTFAKGTRVRVLDQPRRAWPDSEEAKKLGIELIHVGEIGEVTRVGGGYHNQAVSQAYVVTGERHEPMFFSSKLTPIGGLFPAEEIDSWLEPLDDNWGVPPAPLKRRQLPPGQRGVPMKHRRLAPNAVPPPPDPRNDRAWRQWWSTTFPVGARAKMIGGALFVHESGRSQLWDYDCTGWPGCTVYPSGVVTIGPDGPNGIEIYFVVPYGSDAGRWSRWVLPYATAGREQISRMLKPLDDHWPAPPAPLSRPRGLSMKHRRLKPNRRTSKRRTSRRSGRMNP